MTTHSSYAATSTTSTAAGAGGSGGPPTTYLFGRRDRGGVLLGFTAAQVTLLTAGGGAVLAGLVTAGGPGGLAGFAGFGIAVLAAILPVRGRPAVDWTQPTANYLYGRVTGRARYRGGPWRLPHAPGEVPRLQLPGLARDVCVHALDAADPVPGIPTTAVTGAAAAGGGVAVLTRRGRWTVVLRVQAGNYVLADSATQERRVAAWGALLAQSGQEGSRVAGLQWLERTLPDDGHALTDYWHAHGHPDSPYAAAYRELIGHAGPTATVHETYLAVTIDAHRLRRQVRQAGGGSTGAVRVLFTELAWIGPALTQAGLTVAGALDVSGLARLIATQFDPHTPTPVPSAAAGQGTPPVGGTASGPAAPDAPDAPDAPEVRNRAGARDGDRAGPVARLPAAAGWGGGRPDWFAGPVAAEASWSTYRTDGAVHAVYWVAEWPSVPVEAAWCYPLLGLSRVVRTVSVICQPIPPSRSLRELRSARVAKRSDDAHRRRLGQIETAQDDEETLALDRRERELVRGHTEYRFTGWVTLTAPTLEALDAGCALVEQAAVRSALTLRRIHGEVDQAFLAAALPLTHPVGGARS
jgi:hypothetical protein